MNVDFSAALRFVKEFTVELSLAPDLFHQVSHAGKFALRVKAGNTGTNQLLTRIFENPFRSGIAIRDSPFKVRGNDSVMKTVKELRIGGQKRIDFHRAQPLFLRHK